ncbi:MAG: uracil-DNA glycosylase [Daejeonella sp.]
MSIFSLKRKVTPTNIATKTKGMPHPQWPKTINVTAAPKTIAAIINLMKLGIILLSVKFVANICLFKRLINICQRNMSVQLEKSWREVLKNEFEKDYMKNLRVFLQRAKSEGRILYPTGKFIFNAFEHTTFDNVKVVILGQDPYHGSNQAHGLSFSVQKGVPFPPSLQNIFKELQAEFKDFKYPAHGDLTQWADQGVLLLNATLTVEANKAGSHQKQGWEIFTDKVIQTLSEKRSGIVFLLWGKYAQAKAELIDKNKHHVLMSAHPSPFAAHSGFFGNDHFKKANEILEIEGKKGIDWQIN